MVREKNSSLVYSKKIVSLGFCLAAFTFIQCQRNVLVGQGEITKNDPVGIKLLQPPEAKRAPTRDEEVVFTALDLSRPELNEVSKAIGAGDYDEATAAFGKYLRSRQGLRWFDDQDNPTSKYNQQDAQLAAKGEVKGRFVLPYYAFPEGNIDWTFNATKDNPKYSFNNEWHWQLNSMTFWSDMAKAYLAEKDEQYAKAWVKQLRSWMAQCPVPVVFEDKDRDKPGSAWRTIQAGGRMGNSWPDAFFGFVQSPSVSDADWVLFYRGVLEHARFLQAHPTELNWLLMEMNGLATAGCFFPEFKESAEWRKFAFDRLNQESKKQFLPDGAQYELSTGYHNEVVIGNILKTASVAQRSGREKELPEEYFSNLEKAYTWTLYLTTPDMSRPLLNDSWRVSAQKTFKNAVRLFPARKDFLWAASDRREGDIPRQTSVFLDWSGYAVMRSGWDKEANYLVMDVGPLGYAGLMKYGHSHQDKLNVAMWAYGREILFDNDGGNYENSKWRMWARSSLAHNCVVVDGLSQYRGTPEDKDLDPVRVSQKPIDAGWKSTPVYDFATGVYDQEYGASEFSRERVRPVKQRRSVLFLKPDIYIVSDVVDVLDGKPHLVQARWHLLTTRAVVDPVTQVAQTVDEKVPNLAIVPVFTEGLKVSSVSAQENPEILGWNIIRDKNPQMEPATTLLHSREGDGGHSFLTLLIPLRAGEENPVSKVFGSSPACVEFKDGRKLEITLEKDGLIKVREILADGKVGRIVK